MSDQIITLTPQQSDFPPSLRTIYHPPKTLYLKSGCWQKLTTMPAVAIVGSRKVTDYGTRITRELAASLAREGVVVVSGLAYGVDAIAHRAALESGGRTIAVLPGGLDAIYPRAHGALARQIVAQGGALVSEYTSQQPIYRSNFVARNRIVASLATIVLVTEAGHKSGTLHTARFALEQGKDVFAVPGDITRPNSAGTNNLIKSGAGIVTNADDLLLALDIQPATQQAIPRSNDPREQAILDLLAAGVHDGTNLQRTSKLDVVAYHQVMTMLEITGHIRALGNDHWGLSNRSMMSAIPSTSGSSGRM